MNTDTAIEVWHIESTTLDDGSKVYDVIGASDEARVTFNCSSEQAAINLQSLLMQSMDYTGCTAEAA